MFPLYDTNPHNRVPWITLLIIAINLGVYYWQSQQPPVEQIRFVARHGFVPERIHQLNDPQRVVNVRAPLPNQQQVVIVQLPANPASIYLSMFTMMFLHGGWFHVLGNMWFLWIFGNNIEDRLGHFVYTLFYLLGGLFALAAHWVANPDSALPVVGASGAVAAVLGAYAITFPGAKVRTLIFIGIIFIVDIPALIVLLVWFVQQVIAARVGGLEGGVAWWAHIGGFVAGMILMPILSLGASPPDKDWRAESDELFGPRDSHR